MYSDLQQVLNEFSKCMVFNWKEGKEFAKQKTVHLLVLINLNSTDRASHKKSPPNLINVLK